MFCATVYDTVPLPSPSPPGGAVTVTKTGEPPTLETVADHSKPGGVTVTENEKDPPAAPGEALVGAKTKEPHGSANAGTAAPTKRVTKRRRRTKTRAAKGTMMRTSGSRG